MTVIKIDSLYANFPFLKINKFTSKNQEALIYKITFLCFNAILSIV